MSEDIKEYSRIVPLKDLTLAHDFMFGEVMSQEKIAKLFLESLLNQKIAKIQYISNQEQIEDGTESHGVRLDVYLEDKNKTMYNIEIQTVNKYDLERRTRYYQQKIDARTLRKNVKYSKLPDSYIIFVCTFDYFGYGLAVYEVEKIIKNHLNLKYNDGANVFILNSKFSVENASEGICEFLKFLEENNSNASFKSKLAKEVVSAVESVKNDTTREGVYMTLAMKLEESRAEGIEEGRKEIKLYAVKQMIESLGISVEKAMEVMGIEKEEQLEYLKLLELKK